MFLYTQVKQGQKSARREKRNKSQKKTQTKNDMPKSKAQMRYKKIELYFFIPHLRF